LHLALLNKLANLVYNKGEILYGGLVDQPYT